MKKQILNLGKTLSIAEQKLINGGNPGGLDDAPCVPDGDVCHRDGVGKSACCSSCNITASSHPWGICW